MIIYNMIDTITILIIIIIIFAIMLLATMDRVNDLEMKMNIEGFDTSGDSAEAIANVAKLYNDGQFVVTNLKVTGDLEVDGKVNVTGNTKLTTADIGNWKIRNDRIGIKGRGDMHLAPDHWMRLMPYNRGTPTDGKYAGKPGERGGFAGANLWSGYGTVWSKRAHIDGVTLDKHPAHGGVFRITAPLEVDQAMNPNINWDRPGIMAKNLVIPSRNFEWGPQQWWQGPSHQTAVNVANKLPKGSLVIGPAIGNNNSQDAEYENIISAAKKIEKNGCNIRGMFLALNKHSGPPRCK
jgi:hypothetical protein